MQFIWIVTRPNVGLLVRMAVPIQVQAGDFKMKHLQKCNFMGNNISNNLKCETRFRRSPVTEKYAFQKITKLFDHCNILYAIFIVF